MRRPLQLWSMLAGLLLLLGVVLAEKRDFRLLTVVEVEAIVKLDPPEWQAVDAGHMEHLLVPRVSGTENNTKVQEYLSSVMTGLGWAEEKVAHKENTPLGEREFTNLIYTFDPDAPRRLILSAHFDSKWFDGQGFIGATDSAAPCGYLLDIAEALTPLMKARAERIKSGNPRLSATVDEVEDSEVSLQLVFFDGEEAFHQWTSTDSVYGSRNLAEVWDVTPLSDTHPLSRRRGTPNVLDTIDVLVLLDLLGAKSPQITNHYQNTGWMFRELEDIDAYLRKHKLVEGDDRWFNALGRGGHIDDDHRPFLQRGVPILHLIPVPFPDVWHKMSDNVDALDLATCRRWISIMRVFTARYLGLAPDIALEEKPNGDVVTTAVGADLSKETKDAKAVTEKTPKKRKQGKKQERDEL